MAKQKKLTEKDIKHYPKRGEKWEDTSADPVPTYTLKTFNDRGGHKTWSVNKYWLDGQGNPQNATVDLPLLKFAEPGMVMVYNADADDDTDESGSAEGQGTPSVMASAVKNGVKLTCPGIGCGDTKEIIFEPMPFTELIGKLQTEHDNFKLRHDEHMLSGTLFGRRSS